MSASVVIVSGLSCPDEAIFTSQGLSLIPTRIIYTSLILFLMDRLLVPGT